MNIHPFDISLLNLFINMNILLEGGCSYVFKNGIYYRKGRRCFISKTVAIIIVIFLGGLGVHRFLSGKVGTGVIWLLTGGCCGIGWLIDIVKVCMGTYTDKDGNVWGIN